jgi:hypothetical protein
MVLSRVVVVEVTSLPSLDFEIAPLIGIAPVLATLRATPLARDRGAAEVEGACRAVEDVNAGIAAVQRWVPLKL